MKINIDDATTTANQMLDLARKLEGRKLPRRKDLREAAALLNAGSVQLTLLCNGLLMIAKREGAPTDG